MHRFVLACFLLVTLSGCLGADEAPEMEPRPGGLVRIPPAEPTPAPIVVPEPVGPKPVRFLFLGDAGEGDDPQYQIGSQMAELCRTNRTCDFVIYAGDNFYPAGVDSEFDPQWEEKFEMPYSEMEIPFYAAQGNHDQSFVFGSGLNTQKGDNEVAYHYRTDRSSDKWNMPSRWYDFQVENVHIFAMDTNIENVGQGDGSQSAWLQEGLDSSNATWKIAFGHHLYSSNSLHGQSSEYHVYGFNTDFVRRFFQESVCGRADILASGHDHILEWLNPRSGCSGTELIVSGAGHSGREITGSEPSYYTYGDGPGFAWIEILGDNLTLEYYHMGVQEPAFTKTITKADVGANEYEEDPLESPFPLPVPSNPLTRAVLYADGGYDRANQVRNSMAAAEACALRGGCDMVLHVSGSIEHWSPYVDVPENYNWQWGQGVVEYFRLRSDGDLLRQTHWLREALAASDATYKVVYGDLPLISQGGVSALQDAPQYAALLQTVVCGSADVYLSGGSFTLEAMQTPLCPGTELLVTGASSTVQDALLPMPTAFLHDRSVGFWILEATKDGLVATAYDDRARALHESVIA